MTRTQIETRTASEQSAALISVTRRGRLVLVEPEARIELDVAGERFDLLGPFDNAAQPGDDVEVDGVIAPRSKTNDRPAILVRHIRRMRTQ
jgi:hypothetical protein